MKRLIALCSLVVALAMPSVAFAYNPLDAACNSGGSGQVNSAACHQSTNDPINGSHGALRKVTNIIALIGGVAAVIIIIVAGLEYVMAGGDAQKAASARSAIIGAVIGLAIIAAAEAMVTFVVSKL